MTARYSLAVSPYGGECLITFLIGMVIGALILFLILIIAAVMEEDDK